MGQITLVWFGAIVLGAIAALGFGIALRKGSLITIGSSVLAALVGAWLIGPPAGVLTGIVVGGIIRELRRKS